MSPSLDVKTICKKVLTLVKKKKIIIVWPTVSIEIFQIGFKIIIYLYDSSNSELWKLA